MIAGASPEGSAGRKSGSQRVDARLERQLIALDERQRGRGDDGLRHGGQTKQRVDAHLGAGFAIGETGRVLIDEVTIPRDEHDRADDPVLAQCACDDGVDVGANVSLSQASGVAPAVPTARLRRCPCCQEL